MYIICCSIYFNKSPNLCGILYLEASDVGGVYPPPPFFQGKKSIGNGYEIVRAAEFFLQIAHGLSAARVSRGPACPG